MLTGTRRTRGEAIAVSALSEHPDGRTSIAEVADTLHEGLRGAAPDLVLLMTSFQHARVLPEAAVQLRRTLGAGHVLGGTADTVMSDARAPEGRPATSGLALHLPGAGIRVWRSTPRHPLPLSRPNDLPAAVGLDDETRGIFVMGDPYTTPASRMIPLLASCTGRPVPIFGGLLSGASQAGGNCVLLDDLTLNEGCVGVSFSGIEIDVIASEGCKPVGQPHVVTQCDENIIQQLGGRPAIQALQETVESLAERDQELARKGLVVGQAVDSNKTRFGRGDFELRNVMGVHPEKGIAIAAIPRVGRTVQFHVRSAKAADEDLRLQLDGQSLSSSPLAVLATSCKARGRAFFGHEAHDGGVLRERLEKPPMWGFHGVGEFGPTGASATVHAQSIVAAMLRTVG
ncbi:MAG: FIST C-terminal domain-containing protein [Phycisphaerales bacterium]|nr:FIST C-terminal domain-containing protein [Phycisphaerales bacterium]